MGSYPSAALMYGVDLGVDEDRDLSWFTEELEYEHGDITEAAGLLLKEAGLKGVRLETYGNLANYTLSALTTRGIHATAYDAKTVTAEMLQVPDTDTELLQRAWELVGNDGPMPEPSWFIVVSYG
jgi:hypothetical protein